MDIAELGLEPRISGYEPDVLPLHHPATQINIFNPFYDFHYSRNSCAHGTVVSSPRLRRLVTSSGFSKVVFTGAPT